MKPEEIGRLVDVSDPRVSPDGRRVAFVVQTIDLEANEYRSRVWMVPADGSSAARPFTAGKRDAKPRWSPDGLLLAFVSHRQDKPKHSELYVVPVDGGGETQEICKLPEEIEELAWSPDGVRLAFTARERDEAQYAPEKDKDRPARRVRRLSYRLDSVGWTSDRPRHVFVVPADGSARPEALTTGEFQDAGLAWSPDGAWIAFSSGRTETWDTDLGVDLFRVRADGSGEPERLTETGPTFGQPSWSADGRTIAFVRGDRRSIPRHGQVGVFDVEGRSVELLTTDLDRHCAPYLAAARDPMWDGDDVWFQVDDAGNVPLYRVGRDGKSKPDPVVIGDRQVSGFDAAGGTLAFTVASATALPEVFVLVDGDERQLTDLGRSFAESCMVSAPERFSATSSGGAEVEAWVIRPADFDEGRRYPTLLNIHGGPFSQYGNKLFDEFQLQAGAGYVVLYANPRGSSGYSETFARAIRGPLAEEDPGSGWGGVDYQDLMAVVDTALERFPFVDADRLGVLGGSYGGYMTSWIVGHTDRFRAAVSERAVNNLFTMTHTSDIGTSFQQGYLGVSYLDEPEEFLRQSPVTYAEHIRTPLLILHSENDLRCPIEQAEDLFVRLRQLGRDVEFVRFPGESHELTRSGAPKHRVERIEIILEFFGRHLGA